MEFAAKIINTKKLSQRGEINDICFDVKKGGVAYVDDCLYWKKGGVACIHTWLIAYIGK